MRDFDHTVNVLVQAYLKDELAHSLCCACAVGNIVAASLGVKPKKCSDGATEFENNFFDDGRRAAWYDYIHSQYTSYYHEEGRLQIEATGYTSWEIARIEQAFENAPGRPAEDGLWRGKLTEPEWMFNGLMAVVDVLAEIHGIDLKQREEAKLLFQK